MNGMDEIKAAAALTALNEMFQGSHLNICTIDRVAKLLGVHPEREAYDTLHALHCVHWDKMPRDLRNQIPALIQQALGQGDTYFQFELKRPANNSLAVLDESKHTRRPLLQRWLGHG